MTTAVLVMAMAAFTSRHPLPGTGPTGDVRTGVARIQTAVRDGYQASPTFRRLVEQLRWSGAVVYVDAGRCRPGEPLALEGCAVRMASAPTVQYVRVLVDTGGGGDRLVALIGHELQHALEMIGPSRAAVEGREVLPLIEETAGARACQSAILNELRAQRSHRARDR